MVSWNLCMDSQTSICTSIFSTAAIFLDTPLAADKGRASCFCSGSSTKQYRWACLPFAQTNFASPWESFLWPQCYLPVTVFWQNGRTWQFRLVLRIPHHVIPGWYEGVRPEDSAHSESLPFWNGINAVFKSFSADNSLISFSLEAIS